MNPTPVNGNSSSKEGSGWTSRIDLRVPAIGGLLVAASLWLRGFDNEDMLPLIMEGMFYVAVLSLLASHKSLRQMFQALPSAQQLFLASLVGLMLVAQIWTQPQKSFPMVAWDMYTENIATSAYFEYVGICEDGREVEFPVGRIFRSQHRTAMFKLNSLWWQMNSSTDDAQYQQNSERFHALLKALVMRFNEQHPDTQVSSVQIVACTMPKPAPGRKLNVTRRIQREFIVR